MQKPFANAVRKHFASTFKPKILWFYVTENIVTKYYFSLCDILSKCHPDFGGSDFKEFRERKVDQRVRLADQHINDLQLEISSIAVETLKRVPGTKELLSGEKAFWELGREDAVMKQSAYKKQQETPIAKRAPKEAYLDLIDFEKIIRQRSNWDHFAPIFSIPMQGINSKSKTYHLDWLNELNQLRRVSAHGSVYRQYKEEDFVFIDWLKKEIFSDASRLVFLWGINRSEVY